eukprot:8168189-Lingulodinium_polyedra.AAC.1
MTSSELRPIASRSSRTGSASSPVSALRGCGKAVFTSLLCGRRPLFAQSWRARFRPRTEVV